LTAALTKLAALYRELHAAVRDAALPVPHDAQLASNEAAVWSADCALGAASWTDFDNAGWALIETLPGLPDAFCAAYFITAAQRKPKAELAPAAGAKPPAALGVAWCESG